MKRPIDFLTLADIIEIHRNQIQLYGGVHGIRNMALLSSAVAVPCATFDGRYLCHDIFEMAAAYGFHICQNHPFIDGNKRVGLVAALVFLEFNGISTEDPGGELYGMMMGIASGKRNKADLENLLRKLSGR